YGYLNRVRSSRRLEAETHRNIEVIWLLRHLKPDFKTIADCRPSPAGSRGRACVSELAAKELQRAQDAPIPDLRVLTTERRILPRRCPSSSHGRRLAPADLGYSLDQPPFRSLDEERVLVTGRHGRSRTMIKSWLAAPRCHLRINGRWSRGVRP